MDVEKLMKRLSDEDAHLLSQILEDRYGIKTGELRHLPGEFKNSFVARDRDGASFVVKITDAVSTSGRTHMQADLLEHLAQYAPALPVPRVVRSRDDAQAESVTFGEHEALLMLLTWLPGDSMAEYSVPRPELLWEIGETAARFVEGLSDFDHPSATEIHEWHILDAPTRVRSLLHLIVDNAARSDVIDVLDWYDNVVLPRLDRLPVGIVHQDLNDFNILVQRGDDARLHVCGVIDVGDAILTVRVAEIAIACAYAMLRSDDPIAAACDVIAGYCSVLTLTDDEVACVLPLAAARLALNATVWTTRQQAAEDSYAESRMRFTWPLLSQLARIDLEFASAQIRSASGIDPEPLGRILAAWLSEHRASLGPIISTGHRIPYLDLNSEESETPEGYHCHLTAMLSLAARRRTGAAEPATLGLGVHLSLNESRMVLVPLDGTIERIEPENLRLLLRHEPSDGPRFWTQISGVIPEMNSLRSTVRRGDIIGKTPSGHDASVTTNIIVSSVDPGTQWIPTAVRPSRAVVWASRCPDPWYMLGDCAEPPNPEWSASHVLSAREKHLGRSQRSYFHQPMNLLRAQGTWFTDDFGRQYLDGLNNVSHVGHGHPAVTAAATRQMRRLNTNSRFVYPALARYAERLAATLPDPLDVVFFTCTGSEANDLALRIVRQVTGRDDILVIAGAYHGNTTAVTGISPNRYRGPGGVGPPATTHEFAQPNRYRGPYGYDHANPGAAYAADAAVVVNNLVASEHVPAAFFAESLMGTAGQIVFPPGYIEKVFTSVRAAGGLCVSDEVQVGLGRLGDTFWGFEGHGVVPDLVTMGKPLGNGHPIAAVVTTREIADAFDQGMKYFNTFGGNPVSCVIGEAVLDVLEREQLQAHAQTVGRYFKQRLIDLTSRHEFIGDIRGQGLYLGVELVFDRQEKTPAPAHTLLLCERMKDEGVLTYPNGDFNNVLKIKPPMVVTAREIDLFVDVLDEQLARL